MDNLTSENSAVKLADTEELSQAIIDSEIIQTINDSGRLIHIARHKDLGNICIVSDHCETGIICKLRD